MAKSDVFPSHVHQLNSLVCGPSDESAKTKASGGLREPLRSDTHCTHLVMALQEALSQR